MTDHFSMKQENSEMEIKKEPQEFKDVSEPRNPDLGNNDDFKEEISDPENQIDKSEQFSNDHNNVDIDEEKPLRKKRNKKKSRKKDLQPFPEPPAGLVENYYDLDLSVEFLSQLFKYVDELCEYINNGQG